MNCVELTDIAGCTYSPSGISKLKVYAKKDFKGARVRDGEVTEIYAKGAINIPVNVSTKYAGQSSTDLATHKITTFAHNLSKDLIKAVEALKQARVVVIFTTTSGRSFIIGAREGATVTTTATTEDNNGFEISITADSEEALVPVKASAKEANEPVTYRAVYESDPAHCHLINGAPSGVQFAVAMEEIGLYSHEPTGRAYVRVGRSSYNTIIGTFIKGELVKGVPSSKVNTLVCKVSRGEYVDVHPLSITLTPDYTSAVIAVDANIGFYIDRGNTNANITSETENTITVGLSGTLGASYVYIGTVKGEIIKVTVYSTTGEWILETGYWDNSGSWINLKTWKNGN